MNKKKWLGGLLGGSLATTVATIGGLKLNEKITGDKKIRAFGKISDNFNTRSKEFLIEDGGYLPRWEDDEAWQETYNTKHTEPSESATQQKRAIFIGKNPDGTSFRDNCYAKAKENLNGCHSSDGGCTECPRKDSGGLEIRRNKK